MKWFKHYSDARESNSLSRLILDLGFEGYGRYWVLLEFLAGKFDGESTSFAFHPSILRRLMGFRSATKLRQFADRLAIVRGITVDVSSNDVKIEAPILLELQQKDFKKARADRNQVAPKIKNKNKIKKEIKINTKADEVGLKVYACHPDLTDNPEVDKLLALVTESLQAKWIDRYKDTSFIKSEIQHASDWLELHPDRYPKVMGSFLNNWLKRANDQKPSKAAGYQPRLSKAQQTQQNLLNMEFTPDDFK